MIRFLLLISLLIFFSCEDTDTSSSEIELEEDCAGILGGENICGCMDSTAINYDSTATYDDGSCLNTINIIYNVHESLPADWITEFYIIMNNLQNIIPAYQTYFTNLTVYAWNDNIDDPYPGIQGGAYVGGDTDLPIMVMEIPNSEFIYGHIHRYSVIAHEYFHVYQRSLSYSMNLWNDHPDGFDIKWLIEGSAASFESIYIQNYYNYNYFNEQNYVDSSVTTDPSVFESYDSNNIDINYSSSVFMTLALVKELISLNHSEEDAFKLIYKDYMLSEATNQNWEEKFENIFNIEVNDFYERLQSYPVDMNAVLPSASLTLERIFD